MIVLTFENLATLLAIFLTTGSITIILSRGLRRLERRIDAMESKFEQKFDALDTKFEQKLDALDTKFERKFDALDTKFERKFDALDTKFEQKFDALYVKYDDQFDSSETRFERLEREMSGLRTDMVAGFGEVTASIARLEERTNLWEHVIVPLITGRETPAAARTSIAHA